MQETLLQSNSQTKQRIILILIFLFFLSPFIAASYFYSSNGYKPKSLNRGVLLQPMIPLNTIIDSSGKEKMINGLWLMLYVQPGPCDVQCEKVLYNLRQIHVATGKNQNRVGRLWLTTPAMPINVLKIIEKKYPSLIHVEISGKKYKSMMQLIKVQTKIHSKGAIFLVDPQQNLMMMYDVNQDATDIFKDLKRLLSVNS